MCISYNYLFFIKLIFLNPQLVDKIERRLIFESGYKVTNVAQ
jgi:hypothetical protein